jgi:hypothetical protein
MDAKAVRIDSRSVVSSHFDDARQVPAKKHAQHGTAKNAGKYDQTDSNRIHVHLTACGESLDS